MNRDLNRDILFLFKICEKGIRSSEERERYSEIKEFIKSQKEVTKK